MGCVSVFIAIAAAIAISNRNYGLATFLVLCFLGLFLTRRTRNA